MKLLDAILLSLSAGFFIIGVHQMITLGLTQSYWIFMLSSVLLIGYQIRKKKSKEQSQNLKNNPPFKKSKKGKQKQRIK